MYWFNATVCAELVALIDARRLAWLNPISDILSNTVEYVKVCDIGGLILNITQNTSCAIALRQAST